MLSDHKNDDTFEICHHVSSLHDVARHDFTANAKEAWAAIKANDKNLDALGERRINSMLQLGESVAAAKAELKHGEFTPWCRNTLDRGPSWCSAYMRLHEAREDLPPTLAWAAATGHRGAHCFSIEALLSLIAAWRKTIRGDSPSAPKARQKVKVTVAELQNRLDEADAKLRARRDLLPPEVDARVTELTLLAAANDVAAKEEIAKIAVEFLSRYRDLVYCETCSPPQVSKPAPEASSEAQPEAQRAGMGEGAPGLSEKLRRNANRVPFAAARLGGGQ